MSLTKIESQKKQAIDYAYEGYYKKKNSACHIYPVEFVVRTFLGTYPNLKMDKNNYTNKRILDMGFGDGRNFPLLNNLGFKITGIEISEDIIQLAQEKFAQLEIPVELQVGRNSSIPFDANTFDYLLACHAMYYVDPNETFDDNLAEMARVLKPGANLIASLPRTTGTIVQGAEPLGKKGLVKITNDLLGLRNGSIFQMFETAADIETTFADYFENFTIGYCDDNFFGMQQNIWIIVCQRKSA
jgi:ubiquinone/menaquinone biosynthesis C-methylase UbiE